MDKLIENLLNNLNLSEKQKYNNLSLTPLIQAYGMKISYVNSDYALEKKNVEILEINEGGSVPELFIDNMSDERVLFVEGEELIGAKQNRILNTSILLEEKMKAKIPVSCVEQGRWSYSSRNFSGSPRVTPPSIRSSKSSSVTNSLIRSSGSSYKSDQSEVWSEVSRISRRSYASSPTGAMSDVFDSRNKDIQDYLKNFQLLEKQNGMVISLNSEIIGIEYLSRTDVFSNLHQKLIRGYAMDALINQLDSQESGIASDIDNFLNQVLKGEETIFDSIGLGKSHRIMGKEYVGEALIVEDEVIHLAVFKRMMSNY